MSAEPLIQAAKKVLGTFHLKQSGFYAGDVAAALETEQGNIYTGICFDIACGIGFCAEHSAIAEMLKHRETRIIKILALTEKGIIPPCGRCRELLYQVDKDNAATLVYLNEKHSLTLGELLPHHWMS